MAANGEKPMAIDIIGATAPNADPFRRADSGVDPMACGVSRASAADEAFGRLARDGGCLSQGLIQRLPFATRAVGSVCLDRRELLRQAKTRRPGPGDRVCTPLRRRSRQPKLALSAGLCRPAAHGPGPDGAGHVTAAGAQWRGCDHARALLFEHVSRYRQRAGLARGRLLGGLWSSLR